MSGVVGVSGVSGVVGFALAGGQSSRMGEDKALVDWGGKSLLDHTLNRLREATARPPAVLSGPQARYGNHGAPVFADSAFGAGALGGVLTGLERLPEDADWGLFLAVDLPLVPIALLRAFVERVETGIDAVVAFSPSGPEPLCAIYGRACLEPVRRNVEGGQLKMTAFWTEVCVHAFYEEAVADFGDPAQVFRNVNTPEDYAALSTLA